jgi:hypothetical protein
MSGEKKCIITFLSVHHALKAEKVLLKEGLAISMIPVPREISSDCGVALKFECEEEASVAKILESNMVKIESIHHLERKGK